MLEIGKKLKELRESKNISQEQLAKMLGVAEATIANYEAERRTLTIEKLQNILSLLDTNLIDFLSENKENYMNNSEKKIPIISKVSAGTGVFGEDEIIEYLSLPKELNKKCDFATFVTGDSMTPLIQDNNLILIRKSESLENGNIGVFFLNDNVYVKKFSFNPLTKEMKLISLNKDYPIISIKSSDAFHIVGRVVGVLEYNL